MNVTGIIAEYNPFHTGHAYQIAESRRLGADAIVCAMSGNWVQSADCALTDKWTRAELALRGGADLILELPLPWAISSAERFARGGVGVLEATGLVDTLCFGSEAGELSPLVASADALDSAEYPPALCAELKTGISFPEARQRAAARCCGPAAACLSEPNNNLGVEYLRALRALKSEMVPVTVPRRSVEHGATEPNDGYASATAIRALLRAGADTLAEPYLAGGLDLLSARYPEGFADLRRCERAVLARLRTMTEADFAVLPDSGVEEGLPRRLSKVARRAAGVEEFLTVAKTRRYPHARLRRLMLWAFLGLRASDRPEHLPYLRVLGMNDTGRALLREMDQKTPVPVLTKPAHVRKLGEEARRLFSIEDRATELYGLCLPSVPAGGREWTTNPVILSA